MRTEYLTLDGGSGDSAKLAHAARLLLDGQLVAFPTETVYGLAAHSRNPDALAALTKVTGRREQKPHSLLVASARQAETLAHGLPRIAQKLARLYWPGPLTLALAQHDHTLPGATFSAGELALRVPEHPVARSLLALTGVPLAAPSANRAGEPEPVRAEQVRDTLSGQIALILDAGPTRHRQPSTVVRIDNEAVRVHREGAIPAKTVLDRARPTILFVCTGNTCRSPMAAGFCRLGIGDAHKTASYGLFQSSGESLPFKVLSAGVRAELNQPADPLAIEVMRELGLDLNQHRARSLTPEMVDSADWIFTMTRVHRHAIVSLLPDAEPRIQLLSRTQEDIPDPAMRSIHVYRQVRDTIAASLRDVMKLVKGSEV